LLLAAVACAYLLPGIFGHGPWKQDEAYSFGMIHHMLTSGDYLVPTNAGVPFMEKPPLYYWTAALFATVLHPWLSYADGARVTSVFFMLVTLLFVARIARAAWNEEDFLNARVLGTLALFAGTVGMIKHAHDMFTDVALVCGGTIAMYGLLRIALNEQRKTPRLSAALWFGLGVGIAEMSKGLFVPIIYTATALLVGLLVRECRSRSYLRMVSLAVLVSLPFFVIWPVLLAQHSLPLFMEWFWDNNVGRFLGFSVNKLGSDNDHTVIFRALTGFALPGAPLAIVALAGGEWRKTRQPRVAIPLAFTSVCVALLLTSATARQLYLLPLILPLCLLGSAAIDRLHDWVHLSWDWFARLFFGGMTALVWTIYVISIGPVEHHHYFSNLAKWLPLGFITPLQPLMEEIRIRGARTHNLKNINLDLPRNKLIVITGLSGSGKSSLAFDTLYAEGQRRYVESLSAYARQFLQLMEKPDVDLIEGLSPAISIEQKATSHNPRSTVGTVTEIHDYLRLLYARVGTPYCPDHSARAAGRADRVADGRRRAGHAGRHQADDPGAGRGQPQGRARRPVRLKCRPRASCASASRAAPAAKIYEIDDLPKLKKTEKHTIDVVIDRVKVNRDQAAPGRKLRDRAAPGRRPRRGLRDGHRARNTSSRTSSPATSAAIRCRSWSRACSRSTTRWAPARNATAWATSSSSIRSASSPSRTCRWPAGAVKGWDRRNQFYFQMLSSLADHYEFDLDKPFEQLPKTRRTWCCSAPARPCRSPT
jgi:hypothetical protein